MAVHAVPFLVIFPKGWCIVTRTERQAIEGTAGEHKAWNARFAHWRCILVEAAKDWSEFVSSAEDIKALRRTREYRQLRDAAAKALLEYEDNIDDDTLRTLQSIAFQTKAIFGTEPPIIAMVEAELEARGHFRELLHLPAWFKRGLRKKT